MHPRTRCIDAGALPLLALLPATRLAAQSAATVEALAPVLAAEDARRFDGALFATALRSPDSVVQQYTLRAIGRIGDPQGVPLVAEYLARPDSTYDAEAAFALGLIRDTSAVAPLIGWLTGPQAIGQDAALEAATALCRIGGPTAAAFVAQVLSGSSPALRMPDDWSAASTRSVVAATAGWSRASEYAAGYRTSTFWSGRTASARAVTGARRPRRQASPSSCCWNAATSGIRRAGELPDSTCATKAAAVGPPMRQSAVAASSAASWPIAWGPVSHAMIGATAEVSRMRPRANAASAS